MKIKSAIVNFVLALTVLFAILFQSLHSYEHFLSDHQNETHLSDKDFSLDSKHPKHVFKTAHEKCSVCDFTFSAFVSSSNLSFQVANDYFSTDYNFSIKECLFFFSGSLFSLRAPPVLT